MAQSRGNSYRAFDEVAVEQSLELKLANVKNNLRNLRVAHYCKEAESDKVLAHPIRKTGDNGILLPAKEELSALLDRALFRDTWIPTL